MKWSHLHIGFTLIEMVATMAVLGAAVTFIAPLMIEFTNSASLQMETRRGLWETQHTMERISELLRTAPEEAPSGSGIVELTANSFTRHDGRGVRFDDGVVYLFDDSGESVLASGVESFELGMIQRDGVTGVADDPEVEAWRAEVGVNLGLGVMRTAVSLAKPVPEEDAGSLVAAYAFGQNDWTRAVPGDPSQDYVKVVQYGANFKYDSSRGYGYTDLDGLDDSPNNRGKYSGDDEIYDQFIGTKYKVGNDIIFRMDVPNGDYRFVLAGGDASYTHGSSVVVRDGSNAASEQVLVNDIRHSTGQFFRVGFPGHSAPAADGSGTQPVFLAESPSPTLTVTQGYIELRQIDTYDNGGCVCLIEVWQASADDVPYLNFNSFSVLSFGGSQDGSGGRESTYEILDGGYTFRLYGNPWKAIPFPYTVTANTVIEFEFASSIQGEIPGIQTATDMNINANRALQVWGTQKWARIRPPAIAAYDGSGDFQSYSIKLREVYSSYPLGEIAYLVFFNDDDAGALSEAIFKNVVIYEDE